jgi:hypothetical protein
MKNLTKSLFYVLFFSSVSYSTVTPPSILEVVPLSAYSARIAWRNNDVLTEGFLLLRQNRGETSWSIVKTISKTSSSVVDSNLRSNTLYRYSMKAYAGVDTSDMCAPESVTTFKGQLVKPGIKLYWVRPFIKIVITDNNKDEISYSLYRSWRDEPFRVIYTKWPVLGTTGEFIFQDYGAEANDWYQYQVVTEGQDTLVRSDIVSLFTLDYGNMLKSGDSMIVLDKIMSTFPIQFKYWATVCGDSVYLGERNSNDSCYSIINVNNKEKPVFEKVVKYDKGIVSGFGCFAKDSTVGVLRDGTLKKFTLNGGLLVQNEVIANEYPDRYHFPESILTFCNDSVGILYAPGGGGVPDECRFFDYKNGVYPGAPPVKTRHAWETEKSIYQYKFFKDNLYGNYYRFHDNGYNVSNLPAHFYLDVSYYQGPEEYYKLYDIPIQLGKYFISDTRLNKTMRVIHDRTKNLVYAFYNDSMVIFTSSISGYQQDVPVQVIRNNSSVKKQHTCNSLPVKLYDIKGRYLGMLNIRGGKFRNAGISPSAVIAVYPDGNRRVLTGINK